MPCGSKKAADAAFPDFRQRVPVAALAAVLLSLLPEDRARLAALLSGQAEREDRK
jgi:hypothetical protein